MKNYPKIILQWKCRSGGTVSFVAGPWLSTRGGLGGKAPDLFMSERKIIAEIREEHSKQVYFECKFEVNLFWYVSK